MNFESPPPQDESSLNTIKKAVSIGAIGVAALSGEACSPEQKVGNESKSSSQEEKASVHPETRKSRIREGYELQKKQGQYETKLIVDNMKALEVAGTLGKFDLSNNNFLKYYYQGLNGDRNPAIFLEAQQMRILEIAKKKGIEVDLSKELHMEIEGGVVPLSAKVNGITIPITESDYTPRESELVGFIKKMGKQPLADEDALPAKGQKPNLRSSKPTSINDL